ncbi:MAG: hypothetical protein KDJ52_08050 [Anaerolineae bacterium]|nr:hypothetical protein [Anaerolineae bacterium]
MHTWQSRIRAGMIRVVRSILFLVTLVVGTTAVMLMGETSGLALADLSNATVKAVTVADDQVMYAALQGGPQADGIYRSDDKGLTWQRVSSGPDGVLTALVAHHTNPETLFAGTEGGPVTTTNNLWRSYDSGKTWQKLFISLPAHPDGLVPAVTTLAIDDTQPYKLFIGTADSGVYLFDIGADGHGYRLVGGVSGHQMHIKDLVVGERNRVYALTDEGLFVSGDVEAWYALTLPAERPIAIATSTNAIYAAAESGAIYYSSNGGQDWTQIGGNWPAVSEAKLQATALTVDKKNQNHAVVSTAYVIGGQLVGGSIYETYNAGSEWIKIAEANGVVDELLLNSDIIYGVSPTGLRPYQIPMDSDTGSFLGPLGFPVRLNYAQILVIVLTSGLAGIILFGRLDWVHLLQTAA